MAQLPGQLPISTITSEWMDGKKRVLTSNQKMPVVNLVYGRLER